MKFLLLPFAALYNLITYLRNFFYDRNIFKSLNPTIFSISVGNLTVGGTGKTPHIEYLIRKLITQKRKEQNQKTITTLSRGYGRKTKGFLLANLQSSATQIGDEPQQFYQKFHKDIEVVVCEKRAIGIQKIKETLPSTQIILLDDAFQHRAVCPHFSILLSDYNLPFYEDYVLPMGRIRESRKGAKRADVVLVSKSPLALNREEQEVVQQKIRKYTPAPVFFTSFRYGKPCCLFGKNDFEVLTKSLSSFSFGILTGIANPVPFEEHIKNNFSHLGKISIKKHFPDHHHYTQKEIQMILSFQKKTPIIWFITEKDVVKLKPLFSAISEKEKSNLFFFYISIEVFFLNQNEEEDFWKLIREVKSEMP